VTGSWVEHPFHIVKNLFRHKRLRYRGLAKNTAAMRTLFALANLVIVKKTLLAPGRVSPTIKGYAAVRSIISGAGSNWAANASA
jgi:hypothetical protein